MATYDVGDAPTLRTEVRVDGVLTTPDTITLTIQAPDGTITTPTPTEESTGVYTAVVELTQPLTWVYRWATTGTAQAADEGEIYVRRSRIG